jgi:hypothetical protein
MSPAVARRCRRKRRVAIRQGLSTLAVRTVRTASINSVGDVAVARIDTDGT